MKEFIAIISNYIFQKISGLFILITGIWVKFNYRHHVEFLSGDVLSTPVMVILVGGLLTFICFLGCCGSLKENRCMILTFICLAFILFICEISIAVILIQEHVDLNETIETQFNYTFTHFNDREEFRDAFYLVQSEVSIITDRFLFFYSLFEFYCSWRVVVLMDLKTGKNCLTTTLFQTLVALS